MLLCVTRFSNSKGSTYSVLARRGRARLRRRTALTRRNRANNSTKRCYLRGSTARFATYADVCNTETILSNIAGFLPQSILARCMVMLYTLGPAEISEY